MFNRISALLALLVKILAFSSAVAQELPPDVQRLKKQVQLESRREDPVGIFSTFALVGVIAFKDLDDLDEVKAANAKKSEDVQATNSSITKRDLDQMLAEGKERERVREERSKFRPDAYPFLIQTGKTIAEYSVNKYPEIHRGGLGGDLPQSDKSPFISFYVREGFVNGVRLLLAQIQVTGSLNVQNQPYSQSFDLYSRQTPINSLNQLEESCTRLLDAFYANYMASRAARLNN